MKTILIIGQQNSGKSTIAKSIAELVAIKDETIIASISDLNGNLQLRQATPKTKAIIIDNVPLTNKSIELITKYAYSDEIIINKQCEHPFKINPSVLIFISNDNFDRVKYSSHKLTIIKTSRID